MHRVVPALELARSERGRGRKVKAIADALQAVARDGDDELRTATRLVAGQLLSSRDGAVLGAGWALVAGAACHAYGILPADLRARAHALGDLGDAIGELAGSGRIEERRGLTLDDLANLSTSLSQTTDRTTKEAALVVAYVAARPDQAKYLTKVLLGELRIGVRGGILDEAIAIAFGRDVKEVQAAATLCTDPGDLAVLARHDELASAVFTVGSPIAFMLASPIETVKAPLDPAHTAWEDKLDGVRVQVHARPGAVRLFARGGGEVSDVFPEVVRALARVQRPAVFDGELLAVTVGTRGDLSPRPFQALQTRLGRREPDAALLESTPVALFAFDILFDGDALLALPWSERRARLDAFFAEGVFAPVAQATRAHALDPALPLPPQIDAAYAEARGRGHEGVVLKDQRATYESGRRGSAWRKVKRALATLDVVITRAERGHGKRAKVLSDYTFAVRDEATLDELHLVDIGKAYSGLTDKEIAELTTELEAATVGRRGGQLIVTPAIVLEVAFDGLQRSTRHTSGFALRFPRIARIRRDKAPGEVDTLATVRGLWDAQVASGHREEASPRGPATAPTKPGAPARVRKRKEPPANQLALFAREDDDR